MLIYLLEELDGVRVCGLVERFSSKQTEVRDDIAESGGVSESTDLEWLVLKNSYLVHETIKKSNAPDWS